MTAEEIAQWVIDNRYPKSEFDRVSDFEMFHILKENIQEALDVKTTRIADLEKGKEKAEVDLFKNQLDRASEWAKQQHRIIELEKINKELREPVCYEIDFAGSVKCSITIIGNKLNINGAMNGWGDSIPNKEITVNLQQ